MTLDTYLKKKGFGSAARLAKKLNVSPQSIGKWRRNKKVPAERVIPLWHATNNALHPSSIRPDLYPDDLFE